MELCHLRYFLAIVADRHFTRAAQKLGIAQPPLSLQIRQLEGEVGTRLFTRTARGVALTAAGAAFLPHAEARSARSSEPELPRGESATAIWEPSASASPALGARGSGSGLGG